jgi:hypothetical protein
VFTVQDPAETERLLNAYQLVWRRQDSIIRRVGDLITIPCDQIWQIPNDSIWPTDDPANHQTRPSEPSIGTLTATSYEGLTTLLRQTYGEQSDTHFYYWPGYGGLRVDFPLGRVLVGTLPLRMPATGPVVQSPSVFWNPASLWMVSTFCDSASTVVALTGTPIDSSQLPADATTVDKAEQFDDWIIDPRASGPS